MNKLLKKHKDLIIILVIFVFVLVFMVIISSTFAYFKNDKNVIGEIKLGELDFEILTDATTFKNLLPGDSVNYNVKIENKVANKKNLVPFYFRFKIANNDNEKFLNLINFNTGINYIKKDNFYYYKNKLNVGESVKLVDKIQINTEMTNKDINAINFIILVEAVQSENGAFKEIFEDAPEEWIEFIENN